MIFSFPGAGKEFIVLVVRCFSERLRGLALFCLFVGYSAPAFSVFHPVSTPTSLDEVSHVLLNHPVGPSPTLRLWETDRFWHIRYAASQASVVWNHIPKTSISSALWQQSRAVFEPGAALATRREEQQRQQVVLHRVYQVFFAPLFEGSPPPTLQVMAEGRWQGFPLAAMILSWDANHRPLYWLHHTDFRYGPTTQERPVRRVTALAPFSGDNAVESRLEKLPWAGQEVSTFGNAYHYEGKEATVARFTDALASQAAVHVATHGTEVPSQLWMASPAGELDSVSAAALQHWEANSPLVVLAACQSGGGAIGQGPTLVEALLTAGVDQVVAHAVEVEDWAGYQIMGEFYARLPHAANPLVALSEAQRWYMQQADAFRLHPFYWSGWQLYGGSPFALAVPSILLWEWLTLLAMALWWGRKIYWKRRALFLAD